MPNIDNGERDRRRVNTLITCQPPCLGRLLRVFEDSAWTFVQRPGDVLDVSGLNP